MGPCGSNEVTCHVSGYDEEGILTYDWKVYFDRFFVLYEYMFAVPFVSYFWEFPNEHF